MLDVTFRRLSGRFYSPDDTPANSTRWRIDIPNDPNFIPALRELIAVLASEEAWLVRDGALSQIDAAALAMKMYASFRKDDTMLGVVVPFATTDTPPTMLLCDGSSYDAADYPELFAVINPMLIIDSDTFKTPDLRGRFIMAAGNDDYSEYSIGGEYNHPLTPSELPFHQHTTNPHVHAYTLTTGVPSGAGEILGAADLTGQIPSVTGDSGYLTDNGVGGDEAHNNTPPYYVLRYAIVAKVG